MPWSILADSARSGTGTITPVYPAGWAADDIFVIFIETNASDTVATPTGYTASSMNPSGASDTRLWMFWRRAVGGDTAPVIADPGNHMLVWLFAIRGATTTGNPFRAETANNVAASTTADFLATSATAGDLGILVNVVGTQGTFTAGDNSTYTNLQTPPLFVGSASTTQGDDGSMAVIMGDVPTTANIDATGIWSASVVQANGGFSMIPAADADINTARVGIGVISGPDPNSLRTARVGIGVVINTNEADNAVRTARIGIGVVIDTNSPPPGGSTKGSICILW